MIQNLLTEPQYGFLKTDPHLGKHLILLGLAGSYAYGTNQENSDIDIRGVTLNRKSDLVGMTSYEQYTDGETDTVIYTFNKIIRLLEIKSLTPESGAGERIEVLNSFSGEQLDSYKKLLDSMADDRKVPWDGLNKLFLESIR